MSEPALSFIIPLVRLNDYVRETVERLKALSNPDWEAIIVTNEPQLTEWGDDKRIRLIDSGAVGPAQKRDMAARIAQGSILTFIDDDSYPDEQFVDKCLSAFMNNSISAVGGPALTPPSNSFWQKVSGAVFLSRFTGGNPNRYRPVGNQREVDDWPSVNLSVRRNEFISIGGFDTRFWPGEDTFLCWKLKQHGLKIIYVPELTVWHHRREGFMRHLKQVAAYGLHRGYFARHFPSTSRRLRYFLPSLLSVFLVLMPVLISTSNIGYFSSLCLSILYVNSILIGLIEVSRMTSIRIALCSSVYVVGTHLVYGINFIRGFLISGELQSRLRK